MIKRIDQPLQSFNNTVAFARIKALYDTYGKSIGVSIYVQLIDEEITAFFGGVDNCYSAVIKENADIKELESFFTFLGASVFCEGVVNWSCANRVIPSALLEYVGSVNSADIETECKISELYGLLLSGSDGAITLPSFEYWYTDFCARYNNGSASYCAISMAVAVCGFMTDRVSMLTGVAVPIELRRNGLGKRTVELLIQKIHSVYPDSRIVVSADTSAEGFYKKIGFKVIGSVTVCEF